MTPEQFQAITDKAIAPAKKLESLWIKREIELRSKHPEMPEGATLESDAVRKCCIELQRAFGLVK